MGSRAEPARPTIIFFATILLIPFGGCQSDAIPRETRAEIRAMHLRMLTVDGSVGGPPSKIMSLMEKGGLDAAFFVASVEPADSGASGSARARQAALEEIRGIREAAARRPGLIGLGLSPADAYQWEKEGRRAAYVGLDSAGVLGTDLSLLSEFYRAGVRCLTLCGARDNAVCDSALDGSEDRGLSDFGRRVVAECNRIGLIIDLANASEKSVFDVLSASRAPVVVSRAGARGIADHPGSLSDRVIQAIGRAGGVILVSLDPRRIAGRERARRASVADVADHIDYITRLGGEECVGIGSGFGAGGGVSGCRDAGEVLNLTVELLRRGLNEMKVEYIWGGNLMKVFKQVENARAE